MTPTSDTATAQIACTKPPPNTAGTVNRDVNGRLLPGKSLNPGGAQKGLRHKIDSIGDIDRVIAFLFDVVYGKLSAVTRMQDRVAAARELLDRRFGRPQAIVELHEAPSATRAPLSAVDTVKLIAMRDELQRAINTEPEQPDDDEGEDDGEGVAAIDAASTESKP